MSDIVRLDEIDNAILALLTQNARRTVADIAARVNLSPAPVKRRIERMERHGVIAGYTTVVDQARIAPGIDAFTELRFAGDSDVDEIVAGFIGMPEVREVYAIAGDPDALVRVRVDNVENLKQVVGVLRRSGQVTGTKTLMVLDRWVGRGESGGESGVD